MQCSMLGEIQNSKNPEWNVSKNNNVGCQNPSLSEKETKNIKISIWQLYIEKVENIMGMFLLTL